MSSTHSYANLPPAPAALFRRNPVCELCWNECVAMCEEYDGRINFDLMASLTKADRLCYQLVIEANGLKDINYYYHWLEQQLDHSLPAIICSCATVSLSLQLMEDAPEALQQFGSSFSGFIQGEGWDLYHQLSSTANGRGLSLSMYDYGTPLAAEKMEEDMMDGLIRPRESTRTIVVESSDTITINDLYETVQTMSKQIEDMKEQNKQYNVYNAPVCNYNNCSFNTNYYSAPQTTPHSSQPAEDVSPMDTSFFCTDRFTEDVCEKNLREAIDNARSKADACRRIMSLEKCGYILLNTLSDDRKAELINPYAVPRFVFTGDDFRKARNS